MCRGLGRALPLRIEVCAPVSFSESRGAAVTGAADRRIDSHRGACHRRPVVLVPSIRSPAAKSRTTAGPVRGLRRALTIGEIPEMKPCWVDERASGRAGAAGDVDANEPPGTHTMSSLTRPLGCSMATLRRRRCRAMTSMR